MLPTVVLYPPDIIVWQFDQMWILQNAWSGKCEILGAYSWIGTVGRKVEGIEMKDWDNR